MCVRAERDCLVDLKKNVELEYEHTNKVEDTKAPWNALRLL